ncbi:MAG: hypothetical protein EBU40_03130 [Proteobacteria bacterium]|nr:hypothetical protein [Pseudomonadota bacterium]NBQ61259.1 hypothetical protein [Pseudomonadota bacterium]NBT02589.1 hypothetical protein [Pseudomonadota bacterium]NCV00494.1 hypothetical protein [Pseudomonadota bacterium]NDB19686.1 hypothetical protein [Pseudomonadota bacterium]
MTEVHVDRSEVVTPDALLALMQLADSSFPAGLFTFSNGLEMAVNAGLVHDAASLDLYLSDWLAWSVGPGDAVVVAASHRATSSGNVEQLFEIARWVHASRIPREARDASSRPGARMLTTARDLVPFGPGRNVVVALANAVEKGAVPAPYAVAFGACAEACGVPVGAAVLALVQGAAMGLLGAALRLMRIDHRQTQAILRGQAPRIASIAASAVERDWRSISPGHPGLDLIQMHHEGAYVRLFMS